jgi:hypothetical protein
MENDTLILLKLHEVHKIINDKNDKIIIKKLINKIPKPFLIDFKNDFKKSELISPRKVLNQIANKFDYEEIGGYGEYGRKNHWLYENDTYNNLCLLMAKLYKDKKSPLYKNSLELLKIYAEEQLEKTIKKHYEL